jgi:mono/diheme cytochrome c family protein
VAELRRPSRLAVGVLALLATAARAEAPPEVMEVFAAHCVLCHDVEDAPKGLRLDTQAGVNEAIASGVARPGVPEMSSLVTRLQLPIDDEAVMPPVDTPSRPDAREIALLWDWIAGLPPVPEDVDGSPTDDAPAPDIALLQSHGAYVGLLYQGATWLRVDLGRATFPLSDEAMSALRAVGPWVRELGLAGSAVDEGFGEIVRALPRVQTVDASRTTLTTLDSIAAAPELAVFNVAGSSITDDALTEAAESASLTRVVASRTAVTREVAEALMLAHPNLVIDAAPWPEDEAESIGWSPEERAVWAASEAIWAAYARGDWETVLPELHEAWVGASAGGQAVSSPTDWREQEEDGATQSVVTRHTPLRVRVVGDAAIVQSRYYRVPPRGADMADPISLVLTETYVRADNGWKALSTAIAPTPAPEAP